MMFVHILGLAFAFTGIANAQVDLGTAKAFAVLAGSTVTNTGPSIINGDLGVFPGTAITGFPPGVVNGVIHAADAVANQAQNDVTTAYNVAAGQPPTTNLPSQELGGLTLVAGVYRLPGSAQLTGDLTLDGQGASNGVWIFQISSTLNTASGASVILINGALPCNIYWQVGSSATIGTDTTFAGNILALTSITLNTGASSNGGLYARNGAVTLDDNVVNGNPCSAIITTTTTTTTMPTTTTTTTTTPTTTTTTTPTTTTTATPTTTTTTTTPTTTTTTTPTTTPTTTTTTPITSTTMTTTTPATTTTTTIPTTLTTSTTTTSITSVITTTTPTATTTSTISGTTTTKVVTTSRTKKSSQTRIATGSTSTRGTASTAKAPRTYTSTFTTTRIFTITSCGPTVTNCPVGRVTTETVTSSTTWCPGETNKEPINAPTTSLCDYASEIPKITPVATYLASTPAVTTPSISTITKPCSTCGFPTQSALVVTGGAEIYRVSAAGIIAAALAVAVVVM